MADDHHTNEDAGLGAERRVLGGPEEEEEEGMFLGSVDGDDDDVGGGGRGAGTGDGDPGVKGEGDGGTREGSDSGVEANERTGGHNDGYNSGLESLASDHIPASCESSLISYSGLEGSNQDEEEDELEDEGAVAAGLDVTLTEGSPPGSRGDEGHPQPAPICSAEVPAKTPGVQPSSKGRQHHRGGGRGIRLERGQADRRRPESPGAERAPAGTPRSRPTAPRPPRPPGGVQQQHQGGSNGDGDRSTSRTSSSSSGCTRSTSRRTAPGGAAAPGVGATPSPASARAAAATAGRGSSRGPGGRACSAERGSTPGPSSVKAKASGPCEGRRTRDASLTGRKGGRPPSATSSSTTASSSTPRDLRRGGTEDDGRWPSSAIRSRRAEAAAADRLSRRTPSATRDKGHTPPPALESKATALEKYATLPRRRQHEAKRVALASVLAAATTSSSTPGKASSASGAQHHLHGASSSSSGRSVSVSREPSLNRAASLRRQRVATAMTSSMTSGGYRSDADDGGGGGGGGGKCRGARGVREKSLPAYPRRRRPVTIYHEAAVQTTLTKRDVERALSDSKESRKARRKTTGSIATTTCDCEVQANGSGVLQVDVSTCTEETMCSSVSKEDMEGLEAERQVLSEQLRKLSEAHTRLEAEYMRQSQRLSELEGEQGVLAAEKLEAERKLKESMRRVALLLHGSTAEPVRGGSPPGPPEVTVTGGDGDSSLDELERHLLASGQVLSNQQHEIGGLQKICRNLQKDLDKSFSIQKVLKRQLHEMEVESAEMQEFLLAEKSTLADSLRDSETEMSNLRDRLSRQEEECKHLVRISEQRRQENMALQARLTGVERRGRELLLQQGAAVSGASVALSGLSSRLDGLVEQLVAGYGISEQELEDVIFHNEAYTQSSSVEASPEKKRSVPGAAAEGGLPPPAPPTTAPHRPSRRRSPASPGAGASFVSAVISAIKSAAAPFSHRSAATPPPQQQQQVQQQQHHDASSSSEATATQGDETEPPSEDGGVALSEGLLPPLPPARLAGSESLQNLSRAIMQRQVTENEEEEDSLPLSPPHTSPMSSSPSEEGGAGVEGGKASEGRSTPLTPPPSSGADSLVDQVIEVDNLLTKLLKVLRIIQMENDSYLEEMHEERAQLASKVCTEEQKNSKAQEQLKSWDEMGARLRAELSEALVTLQKRTMELEEARVQLSKLQDEAYLPDRLNEKDHVNELSKKYAVGNKVLADNWRQALTEVRRQYVAIDNALETLHSVQGVVLQCPPLAKLQQDLEEANFLSVSSPVIGLDTDPNANAAMPDAISPDGSDIQENGMKEEGLNGRA